MTRPAPAFWKSVWLHAVARAGLEGLRIHDLRHTHASHLIADNIPLTGIQRRLGHSSITVTSDMYGHLLPVVDENIIAATSKSLSKVNFQLILGDSVGESVGETTPDQPETTRTTGEERAAQRAA